MEPLVQPSTPKFYDFLGYMWCFQTAQTGEWSVDHGDTKSTRTTFIIGLNSVKHEYPNGNIAIGYNIHLGPFVLKWSKIISKELLP